MFFRSSIEQEEARAVEDSDLAGIGRGQFGRVARCVNKLDGCVYALKRSLRPVAGSAAERAALTEVYAHAALGTHAHVVRYYSAWAEDDHMIIQSEYCDGGSLQSALRAGALPERELLVLLAHVARGLAYIHAHQLVHMDVKPGNVFICRGDSDEPPSDDGYDDEERPHAAAPHRTYKIGLTLFEAAGGGPLPKNGPEWHAFRDGKLPDLPALSRDFNQLLKKNGPEWHAFRDGKLPKNEPEWHAFRGGPLPKNGPEWHAFRDGKLPDLPALSRDFNQLLKVSCPRTGPSGTPSATSHKITWNDSSVALPNIKRLFKMVDPDPNLRPSAAALRRHPLLHPAGNKSKAQLRRELAAANMQNELLSRKLQEAARCIKSLTPSALSQECAARRTRSAKRLQAPLLDTAQCGAASLRAERRKDRRHNRI
ncbi:Sid-1-like protein2 [Operophtera brumata]|uniref:Sid-1-like protein2 n=1 Tax=Operophtera brumata TaxID=104452 RepID=A0A0L7L3P6_OPEBR|nr:Sid-1-like protein2 [Operophtera brumata]